MLCIQITLFGRFKKLLITAVILISVSPKHRFLNCGILIISINLSENPFRQCNLQKKNFKR